MGLIKTGLKTAVAVKTAHVVHDRIQRRQHAQWAAQGHPAGLAPPAAASVPVAPAAPVASPQPVPSPAPVAADDMTGRLAQLTQLGELRAAGVLTDAEFQVQKARILNG
jgi:hypothetical protein